jgi:DNA segregation ATPase FtsK/SpoIIIE-like protein
MPQLISHWDGLGWQTPNTHNILDLPSLPGDRTGQLRGLATQLVRKFAALGTPVRLKVMEPYSTHTRYHLQPDKVGGRGNERPVTQADLEAILPRLLSELEDVQAAQLISTKPDSSALTLFLRTGGHQALKLRALLQQESFVSSPSYTSLPLGIDLGGGTIVRDLSAIQHLLIVGTSNARLQLITTLAVTLMLFNSPGYLRLGLVGDETSAFRHLMGSPHVLGNIITSMNGFRRLLDGLLKHIVQRRRLMEAQKAPSLEAYNKAALSNKELTPMPCIVILLDTVALSSWTAKQAEWLVPLHQLLSKGPETGLHCIVTSTSLASVPERLMATMPQRVLLRAAVEESQLPIGAPSQFIDGILTELNSNEVTPLETPAVAESEILRVVTYWQNMKNRRNTEKESQGQPASTGNTGLLTLRSDLLPAAIAAPDEPITQVVGIPVISDAVVASAAALAAYLGWLSDGPLHDVLHMSVLEAQETLRILRSLGVLENGEGPVWRFVRLAKPPAPSPEK